ATKEGLQGETGIVPQHIKEKGLGSLFVGNPRRIAIRVEIWLLLVCGKPGDSQARGGQRQLIARRPVDYSAVFGPPRRIVFERLQHSVPEGVASEITIGLVERVIRPTDRRLRDARYQAYRRQNEPRSEERR